MPRRTLWIDTLVNSPLTVASILLLSLNTNLSVTDARLAGMTLFRTIIVLNLAYAVHDSGEGSQGIDLGIGIAQQDAFSAGAAAMPNPGTLGDQSTRGWVYRTRQRVYGFAADQPAVDFVRIDKDIRSQRKLDNGILYLIASQFLQEGAASATQV